MREFQGRGIRKVLLSRTSSFRGAYKIIIYEKAKESTVNMRCRLSDGGPWGPSRAVNAMPVAQANPRLLPCCPPPQ